MDILWVLCSIAAALFSTIRTAMQKHLKSSLSDISIIACRCIFSLPFAFLYFYYLYEDFVITNIVNLSLCIIVISISSLLAIYCLLTTFGHRNFLVGVIYSKTEAIQTIILGFIMFSVYLSLYQISFIILSTIAVFLISLDEGKISFAKILNVFKYKIALLGVLSGMFYAIASLANKQAYSYIEVDNHFIKPSFILLCVFFIQAIFLLFFLKVKKPQELKLLFSKYIKYGLLIGLTGFLGGVFWFTAFLLQEVALVITVGQFGIVFSLLVSHNIFKESITKREILGSSLIILAIIRLSFS